MNTQKDKSVTIPKSPPKRRKQAKQKRSSLNPYYMPQAPYTDEALDKLASELEEWVKNTDDIYINKFWLAKGMTKGSFDHLVGRSERLRESMNFAKELMAIKREEKIHKGEADRQTIAWRQPIYSTEVKEVEEWRSTLKEKEAKAGAGDFIIEQSAIPTSNLVPKKRKELHEATNEDKTQ